MKDYFDGIETFDIDELLKQVHKLPKDWFDLELLEKHLTPEQRAELQKAGSLEELMKMLEERLREQHKNIKVVTVWLARVELHLWGFW